MITAIDLERTFSFKDKEQDILLFDPDPQFSADAVLNFYAQMYPILTTARIDGPEIKDDTVRYTFVSTIGTKG